MSKNIYEDIFPKEQLGELKVSEMRDLKEQETATGIIMMLLLFTLFITTVMVVALILWFNKFTIFLTIVSALTTGSLGLLFVSSYREYKKVIKQVKNRLEEQ